MCEDINQNTPLYLAAAQIGHIDTIKFLTLETKCDPTSRNADNNTALHLAVAKLRGVKLGLGHAGLQLLSVMKYFRICKFPAIAAK